MAGFQSSLNFLITPWRMSNFPIFPGVSGASLTDGKGNIDKYASSSAAAGGTELSSLLEFSAWLVTT